MSIKDEWERVRGDYITYGDPLWQCPHCREKSCHIYGVESKVRKGRCPVCGLELEYPWERRKVVLR